MTTVSQALELVREKFGTEKAEWCDALEKTVHSKNITVSDWNFLVEKLSVVSSGIDGFFEVFDAIVNYTEKHSACVPDMSVLDQMMFEKFGGTYNGVTYDNPDYYFSPTNWEVLLRCNRAYVQAYDGDNDLRLGEDGKGLYCLTALLRCGGIAFTSSEGIAVDVQVPRYPWMRKDEWIEKWRAAHPGEEEQFSDDEIISQYPPVWTDYAYMSTLCERRPDGRIRIPRTFAGLSDAEARQLAAPKDYVDNLVAPKLTRREIASDDTNRYVYTQSYKKTDDGIELMQIGQKDAPANSIARRTANGTLRTNNPTDPLDSVNLRYINSVVGDISTALDELHAYADALIGGGDAQ